MQRQQRKNSGNLRSGRESNLALHECLYQVSMLQDSSITGGSGGDGGGEDDDDDDNNDDNDVHNNNASAEHDTLDIMA